MARPIAFRWVLLAAVALVPPVRPAVHWNSDYDQAFVEARERNVPVLLAFILDGEQQNEQMVRECYSDRSFVRLTTRTVNLIASKGTRDQHGTVKVRGEGEARRICKKFGSVTCAEHQRIESIAFQRFSSAGVMHTPLHLLLSPDGNVLEKADDYTPRDGLMGLIRRAMKQVGPGLDRQEYERVRAALEGAEAALEGKEYGRAVELLRGVEDVRADAPLTRRAHAKLEEVEGMGRALLESAREKVRRKEFVEALSILRGIRKEFGRVRDVARDARKEDELLRRNPLAREAVRIVEMEPRAARLLSKAFEALRRQDHAGAAALLEKVVEKYKGTPSAARAGRKLEEIRSDPRMRKKIEDERTKRDCTLWLTLARNLLRGGKRDEARAYCEKVLESYPDSPYAPEARRLLGKIGKDSVPRAR